jgi:hypothetical protein
MNQWLPRIGWSLLTLIGSLFLLSASAMLFGGVEGEEFAPLRFQRRAFHYFELPLTGIQVWPVRRVVTTTELEQFLIKQKYVPCCTIPARRDLIRSRRSGRSWHAGQASIIRQYLDAMDDQGSNYWLGWTRQQPDLARVLWPEVAALAGEQLYVLLPDLFQLAIAAENAVALRDEFDRMLAGKFEQLAEIRSELEDYTTAAKYYARALDYDPERLSCQIGQARCSAVVGECE